MNPLKINWNNWNNWNNRNAAPGKSPSSLEGKPYPFAFPLKYSLRLCMQLKPQELDIQVSQVTSGPRRGPTFNNRWWNDRREWNLRITNRREKASPKGANHIQSCFCSPPSGTIGECVSYPQVPFPTVIPPAVIHIRPLRGRQDATCESSVR